MQLLLLWTGFPASLSHTRYNRNTFSRISSFVWTFLKLLYRFWLISWIIGRPFFVSRCTCVSIFSGVCHYSHHWSCCSYWVALCQISWKIRLIRSGILAGRSWSFVLECLVWTFLPLRRPLDWTLVCRFFHQNLSNTHQTSLSDSPVPQTYRLSLALWDTHYASTLTQAH